LLSLEFLKMASLLRSLAFSREHRSTEHHRVRGENGNDKPAWKPARNIAFWEFIAC
jgi:hypothetical protein